MTVQTALFNDPYGNWVSGISTAPTVWTGGNTTYPNYGIYLTPQYGTAAMYTWPSWTPDASTLGSDTMIETLFEKMVTRVQPDEKVVVCVDSDVTSEQCQKVAQGLREHGIKGIVIRGARAGTGFEGTPQLPTKEDERVDILARIGELWEQRPGMKLTDLFSWYNGDPMEDKDFAAACEIHFKKVIDGIGLIP